MQTQHSAHAYLSIIATAHYVAYGAVVTQKSNPNPERITDITHDPARVKRGVASAIVDLLGKVARKNRSLVLHLPTRAELVIAQQVLEALDLDENAVRLMLGRRGKAGVHMIQATNALSEIVPTDDDDDDDTPPTAQGEALPPPWQPDPQPQAVQPTPKRVLVKGFGQPTREMVQYVGKVIERAATTGHIVMVEDAVGGVAGAALYFGKRAGVPVIVAGTGEQPRNREVQGERVRYAQVQQFDQVYARSDIALLLVNGVNDRHAQGIAAQISGFGGQPHVIAFA